VAASDQVRPFDVSGADATHVVVELFGGDNDLTDFVLEDLQEMAAGNNGPFAVIALVDFAEEGGKVVELSPQDGLRDIESVGEIDTGDPETLATFIARALTSYPKAKHRALGFWDHGTGVFDETDESEVTLDRSLRSVSRRSRSRSIPARKLFIPKAKIASDARIRAMLHDDTSGGVLTNYEASRVVAAGLSRSGTKGGFDLIFSDTCLNGMIEVLDQFRPHAKVIVGSEDLEPGDGWDYERFFRMMSDEPPADADAWGAIAVNAFETGYKNRPNQHPCTLGAFRTKNDITKAFASFVKAAKPDGRPVFRMLNGIRAESQGFANMDTYDIRDFAERVGKEADGSLKTAAGKLVKAFDDARVATTALGDDVADANGLAFWFPANKREFNATAGTYRRLEFDKAAAWADYLGSHLL
jgi:hypothetical protein